MSIIFLRPFVVLRFSQDFYEPMSDLWPQFHSTIQLEHNESLRNNKTTIAYILWDLLLSNLFYRPSYTP